MRFTRVQVFAATLLSVSALVLLVAMPRFIDRLHAHQAAAVEPGWEGRRVYVDALEFLGRPVSLRTLEADPAQGRAHAQVEVQWGGQTAALDSHGQDDPRLPGMARHESWLAFMQLTLAGAPEGGVDPPPAGSAPGAPLTRLVVVARGPAEGLNPTTWGAASYRDWVYTFAELTPDGGVEVTRSKLRDLDQASWRYFVASVVTPGLYRDASRTMSTMSYPNFRGVRGTLGALGWTFPAMSFASMGFVIGLVVLIGSWASRQRMERLVARREARTAYAPRQ
jgi:hypothetical protein